ncbi:MAG: Holliday junction branch migration protein RuvA [Oscillospiraceae bacterium]|nr:Holliday junction branch migration protein RuvA [Oscillospiraceae bacterium]
MFYHLEGTVSELTAESIVLDCSGVGFEVTITPNTASALKIGEKAKLFITESIGENNFDLFGFLTGKEKQFFKMLTSVSGIGPKAAMSILSYNTPEGLAMAIVNGKEAALTACPGIGKKTAQRVILELKDKISKSVSGTEKAVSGLGLPVMSAAAGGAYDDALTALSVLGYSTSDVVPVLRQVNTEGMTSEQIIKAVLKFMI